MSETGFVATLIANPGEACLHQTLIDKAAKALKATSISILAENIAFDLFFENEVNPNEIAAIGVEASVDIVMQPVAGRRKKMLLADMDSTIIGQECIDELAHEVGLGAQIADETRRAMRGEIDFETALCQRVALLKGLPLTVIDKVMENRIRLNKGAQQLIATMRKNGAYTALVSGGFTLFTQKIADWVGFDEHHANILCHDGSKLDGAVVKPVLGAEAKREKLFELCEKVGCDPSQVMAVGDGANDIAMLQQAGGGVAFHAKPRVREAAKMRIDHGDLTALLYIQGYKLQDFVAS